MDSEAVDVLRRFNRSFTPRIGVLDESFLGMGRPLAAARLLFEIGSGTDGRVGVHDLRQRIGADSGYVSRLLRNLEGDGLIGLDDDPLDGRRRIAHLTDLGWVAWNDLDRRSDARAREVLAGLHADQTGRLARALDEAERLMRCTTIVTKVVDPSDELADAARRRYFEELDRRFPGGFDPAPDSATGRDEMAPPGGAFAVLVGERGTVVGCGGVRRIDDGTVEIKRMWLDPDLRGVGMGRRLLDDLESLAAQLGARTVVLDTNATLTEAISMYRRAGYRPIERYNDNPYADLWFTKALD